MRAALLLALLATPASAACQGDEAFSCRIGKKTLEVCSWKGALIDSYGREGKPELTLAERILAATTRLRQLEAPLTYARIDLLSGPDGQPCLLELELTEPSLFFDQVPGSAARLAALLAAPAADATVRTRMDRA